MTVAAAIVGLGCQAAPPPTGEPTVAKVGFDLSVAKLVDLSWPLGKDTLFWPTATEAFELDVVSAGATPGGWFYAANTFKAPEHGGTHLDAPYHFHETGQTADQIPLTSLIAPAVVIDVAASAELDADLTLTVEQVAAWEMAHGQVPRGAMVLLRTGWSTRWPDRLRYFGSDEVGTANDLHFPSFGVEAARLLIEERGVVALGVDTASIDPGNSKEFPVHRLAGAANVPGLENLRSLDQLPAKGAWVAALPLSIEGGSGAPARVVAFVP
jgi:kynurenine formamidase